MRMRLEPLQGTCSGAAPHPRCASIFSATPGFDLQRIQRRSHPQRSGRLLSAGTIGIQFALHRRCIADTMGLTEAPAIILHTRTQMVVTLLLLQSSISSVAIAAAEDAATAAETTFRALLEEYEQQGSARLFAQRFLELAERHPEDPAAVDALIWVVENVRGRDNTTRVLKLLKSRHLSSEKLATACRSVARARSPAAEDLLRSALNDSPHQSVKVQACYHLAKLLDAEARLLQQLQAQPELLARVMQYYGNDYGAHLTGLDAASLSRKREQVYETMLEAFPDERIRNHTLRELAQRALFAIRHLSVGRPAPEIQGTDVFGEPLRLSDYRGQVVMLTFWGHW